jgi:broad specificity phosphatase PhoE
MRWLVLAACVLFGPAAQADEALWQLVARGGHVLFVRHAETTPGVGDPPGFRIENCATQRNLSGEGRAQARRLGDELKRRGVPVGDVLSSPWCRCRETAQLAFGRSQTWDALANLFGRSGAADKQVRALRPRIAAHAGKDNLVLVSHGSTALALTGQHPGMGELLVLEPQPGGFRVAGRLAIP